MSYSYSNEDMWTIRLTQDDMKDFIQPYTGNGFTGARFDRLLFGADFNKPLHTYAKSLYDDGKAIPLPSWNNIEIYAEGNKYGFDSGRHELELVMDMRDGTVSVKDRWHYNGIQYIDIKGIMILPRQYPQCSCLKLKIDSVNEVEIGFGIIGRHCMEKLDMKFLKSSDGMFIGRYETLPNRKNAAQVLKWQTWGLETVSVDGFESGVTARVLSKEKHVALTIFNSFHCSRDADIALGKSVDAVQSMASEDMESIILNNKALWKDIWNNALAFDGGAFEYGKMLIAHQFYLFASVSCDGEYALSPTGVSYAGWHGRQFWDSDLYMFRALLPMNRDFARSIIDFRYKTMESARIRAYLDGFKGLKYAWQSDSDGVEHSPPMYRDEIHINIWIALAVWDYYMETKDLSYLKEKGWPVISGIANFLASWGVEKTDGHIHMEMVVPPDEEVCEGGPGRCNDNFLTNYGSMKVMKIASECAGLTGNRVNKHWQDFIRKIYLIKPDRDGIIAEYDGYKGEEIKQADLVLAFYPLGYEPEKELIIKNVEYYEKKTKSGPVMTHQMGSIIKMNAGCVDENKEIMRMFEKFKENVKGPHFIVFEIPVWVRESVSIFLTGIGGELQAVIYGYYKCSPGNFKALPRVSDYN